MSEKKELVEKARRLGREYMRIYGGCAPATLLAVADTLNLEVSDELFKAMLGFSSLAGICGNVAGAIAALGLRYGVGREAFEKNPNISFLSFVKLLKPAEVLRDKFAEKYGGYLCDDVQMKVYGRCNVFPTTPEGLEAFSKMDPKELEVFFEKCSAVTADAAEWTVTEILEMDENEN